MLPKVPLSEYESHWAKVLLSPWVSRLVGYKPELRVPSLPPQRASAKDKVNIKKAK